MGRLCRLESPRSAGGSSRGTADSSEDPKQLPSESKNLFFGGFISSPVASLSYIDPRIAYLLSHDRQEILVLHELGGEILPCAHVDRRVGEKRSRVIPAKK